MQEWYTVCCVHSKSDLNIKAAALQSAKKAQLGRNKYVRPPTQPHIPHIPRPCSSFPLIKH